MVINKKNRETVLMAKQVGSETIINIKRKNFVLMVLKLSALLKISSTKATILK